MDMQSVIDNYKSNQLWTEDQEKEAFNILEDKCSVKNRNYYHIKKNFQLVIFGGVKKVTRKNDHKIMATRTNVLSIINNIHTALGHKGEKKTYKTVSEHYANIPILMIRKFIHQCKICTEKLNRSFKRR